ncbi:MAG: ABC transporter permease [Propionivibrio sp.]
METIVHIFPYAIAFAMPLLVTSLGGLYSERSGVVNIGLEGLMVVGGFASAAFTVYLTPSLGPWAIWLSLGVAMVFGALFSVLHAFASISLNANQVISGTAINMIAGAVTVFLARTITGSGNIQLTQGIPRFDVPGLVEVPVIGRLFFYQTYGTTWLILIILVLAAFLLYKTAFGLRLRACGENPHAADAAGINVYRVRYGAVMISGALAGLGGATILVTYSGEFSGSVAGMGFLALAALIFGQWKPTGVLGATFFFGFAATLANASQAEPALKAIPEVVLKVFPYVLTLLALVFFSKSTQAPRAAGEPFEKGKR